MSPAEEPMSAADQGQGPTVLLVEDEVLLRLAVAEELRVRGFVVVEAANAEEARNLVLAGVAVDLVMSDISMPGELDGAGLAAWLDEAGVSAPIILTSGLPSVLTQAQARCPHVKAFLPKPYNQAALVARIEALLAAREAG
jgi:DNA-binding response OmpR family regulator